MTRPARTNRLIDPPFLTHLGARIADLDEGGEVVLDLKPEFCNSRQIAHGGLLMTMLDVSMARAARARRRQDGQEDHGVATIEMKSTFIRSGTGPSLVAKATCIDRTATMAFCEGEVRDQAGKLVAKASGTFKFVNARAPASAAG